MHARIRVRTRGGQEISPGSVDVFTRLVADGDVSEDDLIYDAVTGEWAPARVHPVYRLVVDRLDRTSTASDGEDGSDANAVRKDDMAAAAGSDAGLGLSLAPAAPEPTPAEANAAFIAEMEAERAADPERSAVHDELRIVGGGSAVGVIDVFDEPDEPASGAPDPATVLEARPRMRRSTRRRMWWGVGAVTLVTAAVSAAAAWSQSRPAEQVPALATSVPPERAAPVSEDQARGRALQAVVDDAESLMTELEVGPIPSVWLEGEYLANAASYPEVRASWERYLGFLWALRANEEARYREAYTAALDREGVAGPTRTMRLGSALVAFRGGRPEREEAYERIEELAVAALSLHDLLVHLSGSIRYVPAVGAGIVSADPAIEAVGVDEATQQLLDDALDRITAAVEAGGQGPAKRDDVPDWVERQVRAALTR